MVNFCTRRAPCIQLLFDYFLTFFRMCTVFRGLYGTPFVMWAGLAYPVVQTIGKSHGVSMLRERGGCIRLLLTLTLYAEQFFFGGAL